MWYQSHVCAAKAAIDALTRSLALEWGEYGIRVNGIAPGPIADTAGFTKLGVSLMESDSSEHPLLESIPLKRLGTKWDVAMSVLYICSSAGQNISGSILVNDGANWLHKPQILDRETVQSYSRSIEKKSREEGIATKSKL
jgi:peroxisomal 2,4-dienoyl-CoA reductase